MKKLNILIVAALAVAGWSCEDDNFVTPPSNPQLPVMDEIDLSVYPIVPEEIVLPVLNDNNEMLTIGQIDILENFPADYELVFVGEIAREAEFVHTATFPVELDENLLKVSPDDLSGAFAKAISKAPSAKEAFIRVAGYAVNGDAQVRMGGLDVYYVYGVTTVTPLPSEFVIEDAYGLLGTINGWNVATAVMFNHEGDPYENPVFTIQVSVSASEAAEGWWWKVVPQSTIATGNWVDAANGSFGVEDNGDDALSGILVGRTDTEDCGAGCLKTPGNFILTINMEEMTYEFVELPSVLWVPGDLNGWNHGVCPQLPAAGGTTYKGFVPCSGGFKFTNVAGWDGINYGYAGEGLLSTDGGAGNISVPEAGLYYAVVDTEALTYSMTPMTSVGLIGGFNGWGSQYPMTSSDYGIWTCTVDLPAGDEVKVRFNDDWSYNLGGNTSNLTEGGDNIVIGDAGTYTVTLNLASYPYTITFSK